MKLSWRFLFCSLILLLVDLLWVASSEITEYLYHEKNFKKPFFMAYTKSIMFTMYLFGFIFFDSWWLQKSHLNPGDYYSIVSDSSQQNLTLEDEDDTNDETNNEIDLANSEEGPIINCTSQDMELVKSSQSSVSNFISDSVWLPIKRCSDTSSLSGKSSETEDEESISGDVHMFIENDPSNAILGNQKKNSKKTSGNNRLQDKKNLLKSKRAVRFSNLIEVRQLSDKHADDAFLSRLSYSSFMRVLYQRNRQKLESSEDSNQQLVISSSNLLYNSPKLNIKETALLAFYFTWIWFAAHLSFHMGLQYSEAGLVNVLSSTTPLFTLLLAILFPSSSVTDSLSLTKLLCVLVSISSVAMISNIEPVNHSHLQTAKYTNSNGKLNMLTGTILPLGSIWSLCGAFFYAVYIVLMRYNLSHDTMLNFPMFFGFIGLFSMIFMFPFILLLNFTQIEIFQWPTNDQWFLILINGICGTVISELLWLLGSFMTSSLVGTIAVSFTIPMSVFFDVFFKNIQYPRLFFLGTIPMFFSFVFIICISQYENWDPILNLLEKCLYSLGSSKLRYGSIRLENTSDATTNIGNSFNCKINDEINRTPSTENHYSITKELDPSNSVEFSGNYSTSNNESSYTTTITVSNNRRFSSGKKDSSSDSSTIVSSASTRHFSFNKQLIEDEDQEQTQSLIEAEDSILI